jgi:hypothetical protein
MGQCHCKSTSIQVCKGNENIIIDLSEKRFFSRLRKFYLIGAHNVFVTLFFVDNNCLEIRGDTSHAGTLSAGQFDLKQCLHKKVWPCLHFAIFICTLLFLYFTQVMPACA